jgi:hypothetical protein
LACRREQLESAKTADQVCFKKSHCTLLQILTSFIPHLLIELHVFLIGIFISSGMHHSWRWSTMERCTDSCGIINYAELPALDIIVFTNLLDLPSF